MTNRSVCRRDANRAVGLAAAASLFVAAGCTVGPDYARPELPTPERYTEAPPPAPVTVLAAGSGNPSQRLVQGMDLPSQWWALFRSPPLDELVRAGLARNPSVAGAQAALRAAQENLRAQQGEAYPSANVSYAGSRQRIADPLASPAASNAYLYNLHTVSLNVSYVPDLFGANRRAVQSLQAQTESARWEAEATYLTLTSNLVAAAVGEASLRAQIDANRQLIAIQQDVLDRYRKLRVLGQAAGVDLAQQEASLATAQTSLPPLEKALAQQRDLIKALSGRLPADPLGTEFTLDTLTLPQDLPATLPSTLVDRRPDVLAAEEQLRAASANIGVAVAARLPGVTLGVNSWGSSAYSLSDLFKSGTGFWTLAGGVAQPIFDAGTLGHREAATRAAYDQAAAQYRSTVIAAYQGVADALQALRIDSDALGAATRAQAAADHGLALARGQLALGDTSGLAVLVAQQTSLQAMLGMVQARAARMSDTVALFQALGGGWWNRDPSTASTGSP